MLSLVRVQFDNDDNVDYVGNGGAGGQVLDLKPRLVRVQFDNDDNVDYVGKGGAGGPGSGPGAASSQGRGGNGARMELLWQPEVI